MTPSLKIRKWVRKKGLQWGMIKYKLEDGVFVAEIYSDPFLCRNYTYEILVQLPEFETKRIASSDPKKRMNLRNAKETCERIIELLDEAKKPGNSWIAKGVTLGFTSIEEMQHLKPKP